MEIYGEELVRVKAYLKKDLRGMNIRQISEGLKISRNLASKYLDILTAQEEVECRVYGKSRVFFLSPRVPVLDLMKYSSRLVVAVSIDQEIVQANDAFLRFIGLVRNDVLHRRLSEIPSALVNNDFIPAHLHLAIAGMEITRELSLTTDTGDRYYTLTLTPTRFKDNSPGCILIFEDISSKKTVETALRESEELFRVLSDTSPAGIIVYQGMQFVYVNDYMVRLTGYSKEELYTMEFWQIFPPELQALTRERGLARQRGEDVIPRYTIRFITKAGVERWADLSSGNIMYRGKPAVIVHLLDITDRRQTEESLSECENRFFTLCGLSRDGIAIADLAGTLLYANDRFGEMVGPKPASDALANANILTLLTPYSHNRVIRDVSMIAKNSEPDQIHFRICTPGTGNAWIPGRAWDIVYNGAPAVLFTLHLTSNPAPTNAPAADGCRTTRPRARKCAGAAGPV
ncbi:MAG: PAS domain S-box protein [Methanomicrobiales archaeon]|nr:PAS domain S-box protein [Methanomicrobiales archaeon]